MYYLRSFGSPGREITELVWGLLWLSTGVVVITAVLLGAGLLLRAQRLRYEREDRWTIERTHEIGALRWIYAGLVVTLGALAFMTYWTVVSLAAIRAPGEGPPVTIEIVAHQWWWEVFYRGENGDIAFETANEIHVPVGEPVKLVLRSADVIHTFWVPLVSGKMDMIPGQVNTTWLRADVTGVYRGQCLEYCGLQHAHMGLLLIAEPPEEFAAWWDLQTPPARPGDADSPARGQATEPIRAGSAAAPAVKADSALEPEEKEASGE